MVLNMYPNSCHIILTTDCNLSCSYCFINKDNYNDIELSIESIENAIAHFLRFPGYVKTISFGGGEPLLRFGKLKRIYNYIHKNNNHKDSKLIIALASNGTLLNESRCMFLKRNKINLKISIDGKEIVHNYNRPYKTKRYESSYKSIVDNLSRYYFIKGEEYSNAVGAQLVFSPLTVRNLLDNIKAIWNIGFRYIDFYPELYYDWSSEELDIMSREFEKFTDFYISIFNKAKKSTEIFYNTLLHNFVKGSNVYKPLQCNRLHLDCNGIFYYCEKVFSLSKAKRRNFIVGNAKDGIDNKLRIHLLEQKRKEIRNLTQKDCRNCKYVKYCFCPIGHYIFFSNKGINFKQYFPKFCRLSQIYIMNLLNIKERLVNNKFFKKSYLSN